MFLYVSHRMPEGKAVGRCLSRDADLVVALRAEEAMGRLDARRCIKD